MKCADSLDTVEYMMEIEKIFQVTLGDEHIAGNLELLTWLEAQLIRKRPGDRAVAELKKIAKREHRPELVEDLDYFWRRQQVEAILRHLASVYGHDKQANS